jgi:hypothetical protein
MAQRVERRLTAILAADVAEYSRLMRGDEDGTLSTLSGRRRSLGIADPPIRVPEKESQPIPPTQQLCGSALRPEDLENGPAPIPIPNQIL